MKKLVILTVLMFIVNIGFSSSQTKGGQKGVVQFSDVIKKIEKKFNVSVTYETNISFKLTEDEVKNAIKVLTAEDALNKILKSKNILVTKIRSDYFVLTRSAKMPIDSSENISTKPNERTINGIVTDEKYEPLPGVVVKAKGTTNATLTDLDGKFELAIADETKFIVVSYIGYKEKEVPVTDSETYQIALSEDDFNIDEIIVSGVAANTPKKKLTVTVEKIGGDDINKAPSSSGASMLQGKLAGVMVKSAYGTPGGGATIKMRGATSLTGSSSPLILVDGIMVQTNLADMNVDDIESVEVVKGAAAAALYGSKAANGVVVVTTKRGNNIKNKFQIKVRNEYGVSNIQKTLAVATHHPFQLAADDADFPYTRYEGVIYDDDNETDEVVSGNPIPTDSAYVDQPYSNIYDLQNSFFQQGRFYTNFVSLASNSKSSNLYMSFENNKNSGIIAMTEGYTRQNFRINADTKINKYISLSTSNLYMNAFSDQAAGSAFSAVLLMPVNSNLQEDNSDGTKYKVNPDNQWSHAQNPLYPLYHLEMNSKRNAFMSNINTKIRFTDWLNLEAKYTLEKLNKNYFTYNKKGYLYGSFIDGQLSKSNYISTVQNYQVTGNFNKVINNFTIKSKVSYLFEGTAWENFSATGKNFVLEGVPQLDFTDQTQTVTNSNEGVINSQNIFGILDFDYKSKYLFSGLVRRDGSSLFGEKERWHTYYRVAGAYRVTEDIRIPGIQELKLRAAIGTSGLRPGFSDQYEIITVSNGKPYRYQKGNKRLKPSQSKEIEYALDMQFLKMFDFNASYSETTTTDAILSVPLASHYGGYAYQVRNAGTVFSNALEMSLNIKAIKTKDINLSFGVNYDRVRQKVVELEINKYYTGPEGAFLIEDEQNYGVIIGKKWVTSLDEMSKQLPEGMTIDNYQINSDGYVILKGTEGSTTEAPIALDQDGDGSPDKVVIADCNTDFNINVNASFSYKGFSLYMLWGIKQGGDVYNKTRQYMYIDNKAAEIDQFGKPETEKKSVYYYQALYDADQINSHFVEDGSFVKLREASLGYTLKFQEKSKMSKVLQSVKFSLIGRNLLTISDYSGYDPEVSSINAANFSYDNYGYPNFRTITGSIEFIF